MMKIRVHNMSDRETVCYPLPLLTGDLEGFSQDGRLLVSSSGDPDGVIDWPIVDGCFKVLVRLQPGENVINLRWDQESLTLRLTYAVPGLTHVVRPVYIVCGDDDGYFQGPEGVDCSPESAVRRIGLGSQVIQTLTAEKMQEQGFGRSTFQLEMDDDHRPVCHVFRSQLRLEEAYSMNGYELWNYFGKELMTSPMFNQKSRTKFYCFMSFTRYHLPQDAPIPKTHSEILKYTRGHTALGGGGLALFGTGNLHTWSDNLSNFNYCLTNRTRMDRRKLMDDSAYREYYWANYATGLGASLHELGHTFDLAHTPTGIMARGFDDLHKVFIVQRRRKGRHSHRQHHKKHHQHHQHHQHHPRERYSSTGSSTSERSCSASSTSSIEEPTLSSSSMGSSSNSSSNYSSSDGYHNYNNLYNNSKNSPKQQPPNNRRGTNSISSQPANSSYNNNSNNSSGNSSSSGSGGGSSRAIPIAGGGRVSNVGNINNINSLSSPALKRKTDVCYGSPYKHNPLRTGTGQPSDVKTGSDLGQSPSLPAKSHNAGSRGHSSHRSSGPSSQTPSQSQRSNSHGRHNNQNKISSSMSSSMSSHHHQHPPNQTSSSNNHKSNQNMSSHSSHTVSHDHHNTNQSRIMSKSMSSHVTSPTGGKPLVVSVEAGFKANTAGAGALTFSVKNYDGSETRQTILEGQTVSEMTYNPDGQVVNKGAKATERRPSAISINSAASSSSSLSSNSTPSTLPSSPVDPPPELTPKVKGEKSEVKYADSAHWFRSSAIVLCYHKWFNKPEGQENGKNPTLNGPYIKSSSGLRLVELRTDPEGTVFHHWEFLGPAPPMDFILKRADVTNMPPDGSIITVMAEDSLGFIMKKKFKVENFI